MNSVIQTCGESLSSECVVLYRVFLLIHIFSLLLIIFYALKFIKYIHENRFVL